MSNPASLGTQYSSKSNYDPSKIHAMQNEVDEVVEVMKSNVQKVLYRDEKLTELDERADRLSESANEFKTSSKKLKRKMWWKNLKMILALSCVGIIVVVIVILATVGFPSSDDDDNLEHIVESLPDHLVQRTTTAILPKKLPAQISDRARRAVLGPLR